MMEANTKNPDQTAQPLIKSAYQKNIFLNETVLLSTQNIR